MERIGETTVAYANTDTSTYDPIGQWAGHVAAEGSTSRLNEHLSYVFDPAGNLNYHTNNGLVQNFQVNSLNELTANTKGGTLTVMVTTTSRATNVTVNGTAASIYGDATFAAPGLSVGTTYTATAADSLGRSLTNTVTVSIAAVEGVNHSFGHFSCFLGSCTIALPHWLNQMLGQDYGLTPQPTSSCQLD